MKLLRLKITDPAGFRSLQPGFEIQFLTEWNYDEAGDFNPYILAGPNGSGKSNVLEVLAAIFYHMECVYLNYKPKIFEYDADNADKNPGGFRGEKAIPDGFEIEYLISLPEFLNMSDASDYAHIKINKEPDKSPVIIMVEGDFFDEQTEERILTRVEAKEVLPKFVIGYSSGENEILSLPFFKMRFIYFDEYKDYLINEGPYSTETEGRLTFLNSEFNQAIILSNLLMQDKKLLKIFKDDVGIDDIKRFQIIIKKYIELDKNQIRENDEDTTRFSKKIIEITENDFGEKQYRLDITQNLEPIIRKLKSCSTCSYEDYDANELYLDYWVNEETKKAFTLNFSSPIELFQAFQILLTLNLHTVKDELKKELYQSSSLYVNETVPTLPSDKRVMRFKNFLIKKAGIEENILIKSLSDGECQLLHSLGMCLLYKDKECLFLLDEPETHFNPDWRAMFISRLWDCFKANLEITDKVIKNLVNAISSDKINALLTMKSKKFSLEDLNDIFKNWSFTEEEIEVVKKHAVRATMCEMLITTHTPFLISDSKKEYVLVFNKDLKNKTIEVSRPDYNTFGASINKITMKTFGKMETISGYAEQQLENIKKRFESGESKQEVLDEVNALLGDSVEKVLFVNRVIDSMEEK